MKKRTFIIIIIVLAVVFSPPFALFRSMAVMLPYSAYHSRSSVQAEKGFEINIPGGLSTGYSDWYPFVMTFNDSPGFDHYIGRDDVSLTIMYNFPSFSLLHGCSRLFDPDSPYFGAFYGAYITETTDGEPYGFSDGIPDIDDVTKIPEFDLEYLVLRPFGLDTDDMVFESSIDDVESGVAYAGYDGWIKYDVDITASSPAHEYSKFDVSYLQYGIPSFSVDGDEFAPINMHGRIYAKYFENSSTAVFFYILSKDEAVLENCDRDILSNSTIDGEI